jgi:hypothetical protein
MALAVRDATSKGSPGPARRPRSGWCAGAVKARWWPAGTAATAGPCRPRASVQRIKERWEREVLYGLERQERRLDRVREALAHTLTPRPRDRDKRRSEQVLPFRTAPRRDGQLELFAPREGRCDWHAATVGRGSGCCLARVPIGRSRTRKERRVEPSFVWHPGRCLSQSARSFGCCAVHDWPAFDNVSSAPLQWLRSRVSGSSLRARGLRGGVASPGTGREESLCRAERPSRGEGRRLGPAGCCA